MHKKRAFTLIELLVVISIIALLLSIIMPALQTAKSRAKLMICMSNQRQIVLATQTYQAANGDYPEHVAAVRTDPKGKGQWWDSPEMMAQNLASNGNRSVVDGGYISEILGGYIDSPDVWFCPLSPIRPDTQITGKDGVDRSYAQVFYDADRVNYPFVRWSYAAFWKYGGFASLLDATETKWNQPPFYGPGLRSDPKVLKAGSKGKLMLSDVLKGYVNPTPQMWASNHPFKESTKGDIYHTKELTNSDFFTVDQNVAGSIVSEEVGKLKLNAAYEDGHVDRYLGSEGIRQASRGRYFLLPNWK